MARLTGEGGWVDAGRGWGARETELRLSGWSRQRWVVVPRLRDGVAGVAESAVDGQLLLGFVEVARGVDLWEYIVLVTSLAVDLEILDQLHRDRGDAVVPRRHGAGLQRGEVRA